MSKLDNKHRYRSVCYIGLGSNIDEPILQLKSAIEKISAIPMSKIVRQSSFYKTKPVGFLEQPDFINAVIIVATNLTPVFLHKELLKIEEQHKRIRSESNRNMPRTLDLDVLFFNKRRINHKNLIVPHPRIIERYFVLCPLFEIAPMVVKRFLGNIEFMSKFKINYAAIKRDICVAI